MQSILIITIMINNTIEIRATTTNKQNSFNFLKLKLKNESF
jgi:hypothetical protein